MLRNTITIALVALALAACGSNFKSEYIGQNLAGERYIDGECAPGYTMAPSGEDRCVPVEVAAGDFNPALDNIVGRPCDSDAALTWTPEGQGLRCVMLDGPRRTIIVHDGVNPPTVAAHGTVNGYARWSEDQSKCDIWLRAGPDGSATWQHELEHCRRGHTHS